MINYIGRLPQSNAPDEHWASFYLSQRLLPQIQLAFDKGFLPSLPSETLLTERCSSLLGNPSPTPLHGDLWSGNYLISTGGEPYLIDPSFYYGHREVDLAMTQLFSGFSPVFYHTYHEIFPLEPGHEVRRDLYQLYYLLVHLNMFGISYRDRVVSIMNSYF